MFSYHYSDAIVVLLLKKFLILKVLSLLCKIVGHKDPPLKKMAVGVCKRCFAVVENSVYKLKE